MSEVAAERKCKQSSRKSLRTTKTSSRANNKSNNCTIVGNISGFVSLFTSQVGGCGIKCLHTSSLFLCSCMRVCMYGRVTDRVYRPCLYQCLIILMPFPRGGWTLFFCHLSMPYSILPILRM